MNAVSAVGALGICAACLGGMQSMISLASETVTRLSDYSACLLPVMASAMAMSGGTVSAGALYAGTALFSGLLSRLIARLLLPGVSVYLVVAAAEAALLGRDRMTEMGAADQARTAGGQTTGTVGLDANGHTLLLRHFPRTHRASP